MRWIKGHKIKYSIMFLLKCFRHLLKIGQLEVKGQSVKINFFSIDVILIRHLSVCVISKGSRNHFSLSTCGCQLFSHRTHVASVRLHFIAFYGMILWNPEIWGIAHWRDIYNWQAFSHFSINSNEFCVNSLFQILTNLEKYIHFLIFFNWSFQKKMGWRNVLRKIISDLFFLCEHIYKYM